VQDSTKTQPGQGTETATCTAKAAVPLIQIQDSLCRNELNKQEIMDKTMNSLTMQANANRNLNQFRKRFGWW